MQFEHPRLGALNRATTVRYAPSGKGYNVSCALQAQGLWSTAIMPLGGPIGYLMEYMLEQTGIQTHIIKVQGETRANTKVIDAQGILTEWNGPGAILSKAELEACLEPIHRLKPEDTLILSGSLPPGVPTSIYAQIINIALSKGATTVLDASGEALRHGLAAKPSLLKPNLLEARELLGLPIQKYAEALQAAKAIQSQGISMVILSLEDKGALFLKENQVCLAIPPKLTTLTPSGAGDAMLAGTIYGLRQNWTWFKVAQHATATACTRVGSSSTLFPDLGQIASHFDKVTLLNEEDIPFDMPL